MCWLLVKGLARSPQTVSQTPTDDPCGRIVFLHRVLTEQKSMLIADTNTRRMAEFQRT